MISVDDMVKSVVDALNGKGMYSNSMFIFTSDNGYLLGEHRLAQKGVAYDEAIRVPLVISGVGVQPGQRSSAMVVNNDLAPTITEFSGLIPLRNIDGRSLKSILQNPTLSNSRQQILIEHFPENTGLIVFDKIAPHSALRSMKSGGNNYTFIDYSNQSAAVSMEYYDLRLDPYQLKNTANLLGGGRTSALKSTVSALSLCVGLTCQTIENAPQP
jgi:arylsulfatase A-like enzyme